jgi:prepilin-type N-terminal cleavage/methylation domain-containing protein
MVLAASRLGNRGTSLLEVSVVVAILGVSTSIAVSRLNAGTRHIDSAHQELVANLRLCRAQAVAGGFHCQVSVTSSTGYRVERMLPPEAPNGPWTADASTSRPVVLPVGVTLSQASGAFEFDTRGSLVSLAARTPVTLTDAGYNRQKDVVLWPSGQVDAG